MLWTLVTRDQFVTTSWSGGTTTQLAIGPEGACYGERDFLWRLSSAKVELERSDFTPLPDYNRLIATLKGELTMKVGEGEPISLVPYQVVSFDGGVPVESWGQCRDFNLMLRKGKCQGALQPLKLEAGAALDWAAPVIAPPTLPGRVLAIYCGEGQVALPEDGVEAAAGQLLLCRQGGDSPVRLESAQGARLMTAVIYLEEALR